MFDFWWQFPEGFLAGGKEGEQLSPRGHLELEAEEDTQVPQLVLALTIP